jgi:putative nucleotidyltransferase with HDIG domain
MPTIPLPQLRPGMVLAAGVESPDGKYHIPAGQELTPAHVRLFRGWRLREVDVALAQPPVPPAAKEQPLSPEEATKARFAHLPLTDPVPAALLEMALARTEALRPARPVRLPAPRTHASGDVPTVEQLLSSDPMLVSLPEVFMRIREVVSDPGSTVEEATAVIGKDPSLTAKLLKLVNSAFYARTLRVSGGLPPGRVDTLSRAVMLLGLNQLSTLAMGVSVLPLFKDIPSECIDMGQFWRHSVGVGVLTKLLAVRMGDPSPERFFVAGLLHDIGRLILFKQAPALAAEALGVAGREGRLLLDVEREIFGFDHGELGGRLLRKWRFPESLEQAVWRHHDPMAGEIPQEPALVCVADMIAGAVLPGCGGERLVARVLPEAWNAIWLTAEDLPDLVETAEAHFEVVCSMFF